MLDEELDQIADELFSRRPAWIEAGSLGNDDTQFILRSAFRAGVDKVVEIGTASGFSTTVLCHALRLACDAKLIGPDFQVVSYDILPRFYGDTSRRTGDAAREQLPEDLLSHIVFRNPATAEDFDAFHVENEIRFLFIDADHRHPAPTIDLLLSLPFLAPGATVILHDINLPVLHPTCLDWGAKHLFDGLPLDKQVASDWYVPNIGRFAIPKDKAAFDRTLREILNSHDWQTSVSKRAQARLML